MKRFFLTLFLTFFLTRIFAVPAYPYPVVFTQPNGDEVTIIMQGDEFVRFAQTLDGFTLLYNEEGYFCYAQQNAQGDIEPSLFYAKEISSRNAEAENFLTKTQKKLRFSSTQNSVYQQIRDMVEKERRESAKITTGVRKLLTILMEYPDRPFVKTQEDFHNMFNQVNYTLYNANGSVKDFFLESSYNKLDVQTTVVGPYTAKKTHGYYADNPQELAREAVYAAKENANINFADFAIGDEVPSFYMIFQGHGQEAGAGVDCIWSHAWGIYPTVVFDGVKISSYACSPELRGSGGKNITWIGVICHEFGHSLGAPDYYDTNYGSDGSYNGTGTWDLQAGGSWNDNGRTPAPPNPRSKVYTYGWATATELNTPQTVTIPSARLYDNAYFRINTQTPNEYFILEHKTRGSFDDFIPGVNMLIYHCAANMYGMNTTSPQKFYPVAANAPMDLPGTGENCQNDYGSINSSECPWPGSTGKQEFTDTTIPAMISWNRVPTNLPITNITNHGDYITFDLLGGGPKENYLVFLPNYFGCTLTPESGSVSPLPAGEEFAFTVSLASSHNKSEIVVKANGVIITPIDNLYTLSNIQSDQVVTVEGLEINTFTITASAGENGKITPSGTIEAPVENVIRFEMTPNLGFSVDEIFVDEISVGNAPYYDFINLEDSHSIYVTFKKGDKYLIETSIDHLEFVTGLGTPSEAKTIIIDAVEGVFYTIRVTAPSQFQISDKGIQWYETFQIGANRLPFTMYIRFNPKTDITEPVSGILTLCAIDAYKEVALTGKIGLDISENATSSISVYPNPTTGELRITNYELLITNVEVFDVYSNKQSILQSLNPLIPQSFNISHLNSGIYFVKITTDKGVVIKKIVKQ